MTIIAQNPLKMEKEGTHQTDREHSMRLIIL